MLASWACDAVFDDLHFRIHAVAANVQRGDDRIHPRGRQILEVEHVAPARPEMSGACADHVSLGPDDDIAALRTLPIVGTLRCGPERYALDLVIALEPGDPLHIGADLH